MSIVKRRLDICGREKAWEYQVETAGRQFQVRAKQIGRAEPEFTCSCGACAVERQTFEAVLLDSSPGPCVHIAEAQRDLRLARQAAAQMMP